MVKRFFTLLLAGMAALSCTLLEQFVNPEPTVLEVTLTASNVSAAQTSVLAVVNCDARWTVTVSEGDWAQVASTTLTSDGGAFTLEFSPNTDEHSRYVTLKVTSGSKISSHIIIQEGLSTFFSPRSITLEGESSGGATFNAPASWTAEITEGEDWLSLETASGKAGTSVIVCSPADANENVGARTANIRLNISGASFDIPVIQGQTDVIYLDGDPTVNLTDEGGEFSILTRTNVTYQITCSESWVKHSDTKALSEATETFLADANQNISPRTATITFSDGKTVSTVTVNQEGHDPVLDLTTPTLSGIFGYSCEFGSDGWNQSCGRLSPSGEYTYMFMSGQYLSVYEIGGVKPDAEKGDSFDITVTKQEKSRRSITKSLSVTVVGADDSLMWLRAGELSWLIIEKPLS